MKELFRIFYPVICGVMFGILLHNIFDAPVWAAVMFGWLVADNTTMYLRIKSNN